MNAAFQYEVARGRSLHLSTKDEFSRVPMDLLNDLGGFRGMRFVKRYELGPEHEQIKRDLEERGYHVREETRSGQ